MFKGLRTRRRRFEHLALPHLPALYRSACQLVPPDSASDLVQETYLRAWKYFSSFEEGSNCRAWLFKILRNVWISNWQRVRLEIPLTDEKTDQIEPYYDWEDDFLRDEMTAEVKASLAELPPDYRLALLLADVEEFSYREVAQIMDCPIGTVMSRLNRGRRLMASSIRARRAETIARKGGVLARE